MGRPTPAEINIDNSMHIFSNTGEAPEKRPLFIVLLIALILRVIWASSYQSYPSQTVTPTMSLHEIWRAVPDTPGRQDS